MLTWPQMRTIAAVWSREPSSTTDDLGDLAAVTVKQFCAD